MAASQAFVCVKGDMRDPVNFAVAQCPFLAKVAAQNGPEYARSIAINPTETASLSEGPDSLKQYEASFQLFHGPSGILPLVQTTHRVSSTSTGGCPFHAHHTAAVAASEDPRDCVTSCKPLPRTLPLATISLSFGPGSNFGDFLRNKLHSKQHSQKRPPQQQRQPPSSSSNSHLANNSSSGGLNPTNHGSANNGFSNSSSSFKPQRPLTGPLGSSSGFGGSTNANLSSNSGLRGLGGSGLSHGPQPPAAAASGAAANPTINPSTTAGQGGLGNLGTIGSSSSTAAFNGVTSNSSGINGPGAGPSPFKGFSNSSSSRASNGSGGGPARGPRAPGSTTRIASSSSSAAKPPTACPLRKWLGPMAGLVFNEYDKLVCPPAIVAARAALAKTAAVQQLRPQKLPVKLVAVAAMSAAANIPCGAVREHFEKFSLGWFIAVHATIPFVAMLRKAVIMPKFSIMVTIASAVLGQMVGSRLERARLQQQAAAVAPDLAAFSAAVCAASSSELNLGTSSSSNKVVRDSAWREKLIAAGKAGLADDPDGATSVAAAAAAVAMCAGEVASGAGGIVGLGSFLPNLPVVKA